MVESKRVIFLDRDGTINIDHGYVHRIEDWEFVSRAPEALNLLSSAGYALAVVTNQAGVADGRFPETAVDNLHAHMQKSLIQECGTRIDAIAYCPHHRDAGCHCRKPNPGLAEKIENAIGPIDYADSWMVGDKESDIGFGANIGTKTALLKSAYWNPQSMKTKPDAIFDSLYEFAKTIRPIP